MKKTNLYANNLPEFSSEIKKSFYNDEKESFAVYDNAHILPLVRILSEDKSKEFFLGGVCDEKFNFIAGHKRRVNSNGVNKECWASYTPTSLSKPQYLDEDVIFGGVLHRHFGHFITESLCRLWYAIKYRTPGQKVVFLKESNFKEKYLKLLNIAGLNSNEIIIIEEPMRFRSVVIPEQSTLFFSYFNSNFIVPHEKMMKDIAPSEHKKVYLSRSKFTKNDIINENYFEDFFRKQGYFIAYPETLTMEEQISLMKGANDIASVMGTASHLVLFAKKNANVIMLLRSRNKFNHMQQMILEAKSHQYVYVDATFNFLPHDYDFPCFFLAPTESWNQFVRDEFNINPSDTLENFLDSPESNISRYFSQWKELSSSKKNRDRIIKKPISELVSSIRNGLQP
ncbi:DUF563 domain-containing protein [Pantoea sp. SOD02]|uniref:glycosyltransferase family 61 protein n=1 Tax=Pantoea sp. SOD02 TaxID=2970818 RepID=UPI00215889AB|nr:glycosyltransferase family 61 protein [Pantoea sp. SOD02]UVC28649.1 glycosyltransferase family 61 protein [Pantoea sp. SOD02]